MTNERHKAGAVGNLSARLKNKIRGAYATMNSKKPSTKKGEELKTQRRANSTIADSLALARKLLSKPELEEFEHWAANLSQATSVQRALGKPETLLGLLPKAIGYKNLLDELNNTLDKLSEFRKEIDSFSADVQALENAVRKNEFLLGLVLVDKIIEQHGYSFWAIETKLALLSSSGDQATGKTLIEKFSIGPVGLNTFYFYHFGVRNEVSQSTSRFHSLVNRRLKESELSEEYKDYAAYRVARTVPQEKGRLAQILSYEHYTTIIDLYFTALRIGASVLAATDEFQVEEVNAAKTLIQFSFSFRNLPGPFTNTQLSLSAAMKADLHQALDGALDPDHVDCDQLSNIYVKGLAAMLSHSGSEADEELLSKHILNYWWTLDAITLDSAANIPRLPEIYSGRWKHQQENPHPLIHECFIQFYKIAPQLGLQQPLNIPSIATNIAPWADSKESAAVIDCLAVRCCWEAFEKGDYPVTMRIMQFALIHNQRLLASLPLRSMFENVDFDRLRVYGISVDLCNCLHWFVQLNNERQNRTFKRFAIEEWVESEGCNDILAACNLLLESDLHPELIEYFLSSTCDISTIELFIEVDGTREALNIKEALLKMASAVSCHSAKQHLTEAEAIREQLAVDEVLGDVDETMVYVDEDALIPVVSRELAGDFERYKTVLTSEGAARSSIDELLKNLKQQSATAFQIPKSVADDLLFQMIQTLLDRFVDDPVYGLDAIIGRRIRHGTISDELRGTLEQLHLIGQRPRTGADYELPHNVTSKIKPYDVSVRRGVTRAFSRFSASIDSLVAQLRDEVFQCKSQGKLRPAFELTVSAIMFAFASDAANEKKNSETFSRELFSTFWLILSSTVERYRLDVKEFTEKSVTEAFLKLHQELKALQINDLNFFANIQGASEELQRRSEVISNWIRIPTIAYAGRKYPLPLVFDAAMAFTKAKKAGFEPVSTEVIEENFALDGHGYPIVFDALCIGLSNIAEHSGIRKGNKVKSNIFWSEKNGCLRFTIISDIGKDIWTKERAQKVDMIRDDISKKLHADRASRTSGSGIAKLATIVQRYKGCNISFQAIDDNQKFELIFDIGVSQHSGAAQSMSLETVADD